MKKTVQLTQILSDMKAIAEEKNLKDRKYGYGSPFTVPYQMVRSLYTGWTERTELIRQCYVGAQQGTQDPYAPTFAAQFDSYMKHLEKFILKDMGYVIKEDNSLFGLTNYKLEKIQ